MEVGTAIQSLGELQMVRHAPPTVPGAGLRATQAVDLDRRVAGDRVGHSAGTPTRHVGRSLVPCAVNLNVKGLDPEVAERLRQQASAEGLSQQEWIRRVLQRTAGRLSPAELVAQRATASPMGDDDFERIAAEAARRRSSSMERLGVPQRGR